MLFFFFEIKGLHGGVRSDPAECAAIFSAPLARAQSRVFSDFRIESKHGNVIGIEVHLPNLLHALKSSNEALSTTIKLTKQGSSPFLSTISQVRRSEEAGLPKPKLIGRQRRMVFDPRLEAIATCCLVAECCASLMSCACRWWTGASMCSRMSPFASSRRRSSSPTRSLPSPLRPLVALACQVFCPARCFSTHSSKSTHRQRVDPSACSASLLCRLQVRLRFSSFKAFASVVDRQKTLAKRARIDASMETGQIVLSVTADTVEMRTFFRGLQQEPLAGACVRACVGELATLQVAGSGFIACSREMILLAGSCCLC